ncbi:MAG: queuosine salvage family protein, partial [Bacilli bacterium]|nr:queuosine salvage family protein [Bacilli bacterium]
MIDKIVESCNYVVNNAKHVIIDYNRLDEFVANIENIEMQHYFTQLPYPLLEMSTEDIVNLLVIYDSINYSFWGNPKWSIQFYDDTIDGSSALLFCIYSLFKAKESEDIFDYLEHMTIDEFELILKGNVPIPLLEKRYKTVANVSKIINQHMNGNFYQYIKNKLNSDELFEVIVKCFPDFEDIRIYDEKTIYFYKLAQLLTSDILHIIKLKEKVAVNYDSLVGCADYK